MWKRITNFELDTVILYVLEVAVLYFKHFRGHPCEIRSGI